MNPRHTIAAILCLTLLYPLSFGPAAWWASEGHMGITTFIAIYRPFTGNGWLSRAMLEYEKLWLPTEPPNLPRKHRNNIPPSSN